jgi:hypothetical protein
MMPVYLIISNNPLYSPQESPLSDFFKSQPITMKTRPNRYARSKFFKLRKLSMHLEVEIGLQ